MKSSIILDVSSKWQVFYYPQRMHDSRIEPDTDIHVASLYSSQSASCGIRLIGDLLLRDASEKASCSNIFTKRFHRTNNSD
ncbi:hypothetical protein AA11825_2049 [Acetobacter pomorum DSM 11825]|nr:hypothetical protein [Acetobacter pomorum]GBR51700.1 hypothetical protein AA11825_2049 [Acetobacter pomorum DSM 11825]